MKRITIAFCTAVLLFACKTKENKADAGTEDTKVASASSSEAKTEPLPDSVMMKNWQAYMTPGKEHQLLASWDGTWSGTVTMWNSPGTPPSTSTVETTNSMILGGRYQQSSHKGTMMGQPFEGVGTMAYDNAKKEFISTWIDNMGTGMATSTGKWAEEGKVINFTGKMLDPSTSKDVEFREVFRVVDNDHQLMEMYANGPDGKEFKNMEIRYTRKK
jgi:hypothetical protein